MVNICCGLLLIIATAVAQSRVDSQDVTSDGKNIPDDKAYRMAVGEKYFASLDDYDRDSWRDPYTMFDYDTEKGKEDKTSLRGKSLEKNNIGASAGMEDEKPVSATAAHPKCDVCSEMELKLSKCDKNEYVYITRWLRKFLRIMNYSPDINLNEVQIVQFLVVNHQLHEISEFLDSKNFKNAQDLESAFDDIVEQFQVFQPESTGISVIFYWIWNNSTIVLTLLFFLVALWYIRVLFHHRLLLKVGTIFAILVSFMWTWIYLYQKEVAKQQATLHSSGYPEECQPISFSYRSIMKHLWKATFAVEDVCAKYYDAQLVNPFWKVTPLMVVSEALSNFILQPFGAIASHCNMFLKNLYSDMSLFMVIPVTCFLFIVLLMLCKYRLQLPFSIVTLEPCDRASGMNRVEFLPFRSTDEHETGHVHLQSLAYTSLQRTVHSDFNAAGDHPQGNLPLEQMPSRASYKHATNICLKDQSSQTDDL